jgi:hypothetical protein
MDPARGNFIKTRQQIKITNFETILPCLTYIESMKHVPVFNLPQATIYVTSGFSYILCDRVQMTLLCNWRPQRNDAANAIPISEKLFVTTKLQNLKQLLYPSIQQRLHQWVFLRVYKTSTWAAPAGSVLQSQAMQSRTDSIPHRGHKPWLLWRTRPVAWDLQVI